MLKYFCFNLIITLYLLNTMANLSFIEPLNEFLTRNAVSLVPSASRFVSVLREEGDYLLFELIPGDEGSEMEITEKPYVYDVMNRLREKNIPYQWLNPGDIPFERKKSTDKERDLFSEKENTVLLVRHPVPGNEQSGLLFIYFRKNLSNFGISLADKPLSTEHKAVSGYLISNAIRNSVVSYRKDLSNYTELNENVKMLIRTNETNVRELEKIRENYGESLLSFCKVHLQELSEKHRRNFVLSDDAIRRIRTFSGNLSLLKLVLDDAASFVSQVYYDDPEIDLAIHEWELNFDKFMTVETVTPETHRIDNRESRAMQLLDKLDKAAQEVIRNRLPLTSTNVGRHCPSPITAPAITDALKKNRKRILQLLKKYPEKWKTIRFQFRPLKNIQEKEQGSDNLAI